MSTVHVDYAVMETIAGTLDTAGTDLDATGGDAPSGVDAGDATYIVTGMLSDIASSAAGLSEGLRAAGSKVRTDMAVYRAADANAQHGLTRPGGSR